MTRNRDSGQALPIYITVVASLLFLALAFLVVGQAGAARNGAQSAADAAALAAAQNARDQLRGGLINSLLEPGNWKDLIEGRKFGTYSACLDAGRFAAQNKSEVVPGGCERLTGWRNGFTVKVKTQQPLGKTVIPGTESKHMTAEATAVIEPKCTFKPDEGDDSPEPPPGEGDEDEEPKQLKLKCDGRDWSIDPENFDFFPDAADLFSVRLSN
ncbi:pilus assembly protein TadG-related protein [Streptomyces sp. TP-A0874]|uniref:pilus assembly protein TadG-related protein n=1 Tax=Streptomyces sp. TP-A0874 TaxID=549819 RepID=UPI000B2815BF|nr:pilus assembly protein TadG-related protein [Streptomyces sp. TP-A0874]